MGDTGSLTIGVILVFCALGMLHLGNVPVGVDYNPVILGLSPMVIPLFDAARVFINRVVKKQNPFLPDKTHIHHRLMAIGLSQRVTMIVIIIWAMFFILINMFLSLYINPTFILLIDLAIWCGLNILISRVLSKRCVTNLQKI